MLDREQVVLETRKIAALEKIGNNLGRISGQLGEILKKKAENVPMSKRAFGKKK